MVGQRELMSVVTPSMFVSHNQPSDEDTDASADQRLEPNCGHIDSPCPLKQWVASRGLGDGEAAEEGEAEER